MTSKSGQVDVNRAWSARYALPSMLYAFCVLFMMGNAPYVAAQNGKKQSPAIQVQSDQQLLDVKSIVVATQGANEESGVSVKKLSRKAMELRSQYDESIRVDELHQIADALTLYVRGLGYTFDTIYLPPQRVKHRVVHFRYQQATLKRINVINNTKISDRSISTPFKPLLNKVLYAPRVENMVYALQAQSNISVFAFYSRGKHAGEVVLNLRADNRPKFHYSLRAENYGADVTGENRLVADLKYKGVLAAFDQASVALLTTQGEGDSTYAFFNYRYPFSSLNSEFEISVGDTRYALGDQLEALDMSGNSRTTRLSIKRMIGHSPQKNHGLSFSYFKKESTLEMGDDSSPFAEEKSSGAKLSWQGSIGHRKHYWKFAYGAAYANGRFETSDSEEFEKIEYHLYASSLIGGKRRFALEPKLYVRGQSVDDVHLPGVESFSLSGIYGVRSATTGSASADTAMIQSVELNFPNTIRTKVKGQPLNLSPYLFWDAGEGEVNSFDGSVDKLDDLQGYGLGLNFYWGKFSANLTYAKAQNDINPEVEDDSQVYLQLRWQ